MVSDKNIGKKRILGIAGIFQCIVFAIANVFLANISYQLIIIPYLRKYFSFEYYDLVPQVLWLVVLIAASIVNGAMISNKWRSFVNMNRLLKAALMSIPNVFVILNVLLNSQQLQYSYVALMVLTIVLPLLVFFTVYESIKYFDGLKSGNPIYPLLFTNPTIYLLIIMVLVVVFVPFMKIFV